MVDKAKVEEAIQLLLEGIGEDVNREGLQGYSGTYCPYVRGNLWRT